MTARTVVRRRAWLLLALGAAVVAVSGCPGCPPRTLGLFFAQAVVVPPGHLGPGATLHKGGDAALNIAIVGDGFTGDNASQQAYRDAADAFSNRLLQNEPFGGMSDALTVFRVDVISDEAGIDVPADCNGQSYDPSPTFAFSRSAKNPANILGVSWCAQAAVTGQPVKYLLSSTSPMVHALAQSTGVVPDITVVLVNDWMFGATAWPDEGVVYVSIGQNLVGDLQPTTHALLQPNVPTAYPDVAIHEVGHVAPFFLLDEYSKNLTPPLDNATADVIDASANLTTTLAPLKWQALADVTVPPPTDCSLVQPQAGGVPGGYWYVDGVFHPACTCKMNNTYDAPFCVVCRQQIMGGLAVHLVHGDWMHQAVQSWIVLDSLVPSTGSSESQYSIKYSISVGPEPVQGQWPETGFTRPLPPGHALIVGKVFGPFVLPSAMHPDFSYQWIARARDSSTGRAPAVVAQDHFELVWPTSGARIVASSHSNYRLTVGLIKGR